MWLQHNKVHNLRLAVQSVDGIIIQPGETFSYWGLLEKPTKRRGYVEGMQLFYGQITRRDLMKYSQLIGEGIQGIMSFIVVSTRWMAHLLTIFLSLAIMR